MSAPHLFILFVWLLVINTAFWSVADLVFEQNPAICIACAVLPWLLVYLVFLSYLLY